jgi:hypothetical protein
MTPLFLAISAEANRRLFELSQSLGQCLGLYEASRLEEILRLLSGYLRLLARLEKLSNDDAFLPMTTTFFVSRVHLRTLVQNLIRVSEFSAAGVGSLMAAPMPGGSCAEEFDSVDFLFRPELYLSVGGRPAKTFRYLSGRLAALVAEVATVLGAARFYTVAEYLMEGIRELGRLTTLALTVSCDTVQVPYLLVNIRKMLWSFITLDYHMQ